MILYWPQYNVLSFGKCYKLSCQLLVILLTILFSRISCLCGMVCLV